MNKLLSTHELFLVALILVACAPIVSPAPATPTFPPASIAESATLTPIPTLGSESSWLDPAVQTSVIVGRPSSSGEDIYRLASDGSVPTKLTTLSDLFRVIASPKGKYLALQTRPSEGVLQDVLSLLSLSDQKIDPIAKNTWITSLAWAPSEDALAYTQWTNNGVQVVLYDLTSQQTRTLFEWNGNGPWEITAWVLGGEKLLLQHIVGGGLLSDQAALLDIHTNEIQIIYKDETQLTGIVSAAPGGQVALVTQALSTTAPRVKLQLLDLTSGALTPLIEREDANALIASVLVWSPDGKRVAFTVSDKSEKGATGIDKIVVLDVGSGQASDVTEVAGNGILARPMAWLSDDMLLARNLGGESLDEVLYTIRVDGSGTHLLINLSGGRFLAVLP
jgi:dipeptidyl aminopeptidase/acylaminoacyl peptidase